MFLGKKSDNNLYSEDSQDFIPVACHYDGNTLLTKNGELVQTIEIRGLNSTKISERLEHLREEVRNAIHSGADSNQFAFWVHTIRRKANLDDDSDYHNKLSDNIHEAWKNENSWHDRFVNRLYITVVHDAPSLKIKKFNSFINSLLPNTISEFEESFFKRASIKLTKTVDAILDELKLYNCRKLGIVEDGEDCYSDPMFLYARIIQLREDRCPVPTEDISTALADHEYILGNDKIEVLGEEGKKFAAIMSIKEYQEVSSEALDQFLQIPVEMITTEVFYFVDRKEVVPKFKYQNYILGVSEDSHLQEIKGLDKMMDHSNDDLKFCHQQISFMVIGDDIERLEQQVSKASNALSKIGIVHVREDVNLEKIFWSQLPGNFSFLSKMKPQIFSNTAALSSLHSYATGHRHNPWGRAVTLLNTERGTPYFLNFHEPSGEGSTCIFGDTKVGKTTLMNFLISESTKYKPTVIYVTENKESDLFLGAMGAQWLTDDKNIINPLLCEDTKTNREFLFEFFKIIAKHHFSPLKQVDLDELKKLSDSVFKIDIKKRSLSKIIASLKKTKDSENTIKNRLSEFTTGGTYSKIFDVKEPIILSEGDIIVLDLHKFDDKAYIKKNYPREKKLVSQFEYDLNTMRSVKMALTLSMQNLINTAGKGPKILATDNLHQIANLHFYSDIVSSLMENMNKINGVFLTTVHLEILRSLYNENIPQKWIKEMNTSFIFPPEISSTNLGKILSLDPVYIEQLNNLSIDSRMFLIKQEGKVISSGLGIEKLPALIRFLSSGREEKLLYEEIVKEFGDDKPETWVQALFEEFEDIKNTV